MSQLAFRLRLFGFFTLIAFLLVWFYDTSNQFEAMVSKMGALQAQVNQLHMHSHNDSTKIQETVLASISQMEESISMLQEQIRQSTEAALNNTNHPVHIPPVPPPVHVDPLEELFPKGKYAYAFYLAQNAYTPGIMVDLQSLKDLKSHPNIDIVVMHLANIPSHELTRFQKLGAKTKLIQPIPYNGDMYYSNVMVKLRVFQLTEYKRVVYLEADSLPINNLDHLFHIPECQVAAPHAYWINPTWVTTFLMVVEPSDETWRTIQSKYLEAPPKSNFFDMDLVNNEFMPRMLVLPPIYGMISNEWETKGRVEWFGPPDQVWPKTKIVHFVGTKPWNCDHNLIRPQHPHAHENFYKVWDTWFSRRDRAYAASN